MDEIRIKNTVLWGPLRYISIIAFVITAYGTGRAILSFIELMRQPAMDPLLVILWLLTAPLTLAAIVAFFYAQKLLTDGQRPGTAITVGFALMVLSSVSNLISLASSLDGEGLSFMIIAGIVLVCYIIGFLYFQRIGTKPLTLFASGLGVLCGGYYLLNGIKLVIEQPNQLLGYLFVSYLSAFLVALVVLFFVICTDFGPMIEDVTGTTDKAGEE